MIESLFIKKNSFTQYNFPDRCTKKELFNDNYSASYYNRWPTGTFDFDLEIGPSNLTDGCVDDWYGEVCLVFLTPSELGVRDNTWMGPTNANWNESSSYWSLNQIPDQNHNVVIPAGSMVTIEPNKVGYAFTIEVEEGGTLNVSDGAMLEVVGEN